MGNGEEFLVNCWHCGAQFNAYEAPFCNHVDASKVCPFCLQCSCDAPPKYKEDFIRNCPKKMFEEKISRQEGRDLKLGEILLNAGKINETQLNTAIKDQSISKKPLGEILMSMGLITDEELKIILVDQKDMTKLNLDKFEVDFNLVDRIGKKFCLHYRIIPIEFVKMDKQKILRFVVGSKEDLHRIKLIDALKNIVLVPYLADPEKVNALLEEIKSEDILILK